VSTEGIGLPWDDGEQVISKRGSSRELICRTPRLAHITLVRQLTWTSRSTKRAHAANVWPKLVIANGHPPLSAGRARHDYL